MIQFTQLKTKKSKLHSCNNERLKVQPNPIHESEQRKYEMKGNKKEKQGGVMRIT